MAYKNDKERDEAIQKWKSAALQQRDPAGYASHKQKVDAYNSGGGVSKAALKKAARKAAREERQEILSQGYVRDMSGGDLESLLNYQPDLGSKDQVNFDDKMAEIRGIGEALTEKLDDHHGKIKKIGDFKQNEELVKYRGEGAEYDRGGRYLGGGNMPTNPDMRVTKKGKLRKISDEMKAADPYGKLAVQKTYKDYAKEPKKLRKGINKQLKSLGISNRKIKKSMKY